MIKDQHSPSSFCTRAARGLKAWAALPALAAAAFGVATSANGQAASFPWENVPVNVDSGDVEAERGPDQEAQVVYSEVVGDNHAEWVRLEFGEVELAGSRRAGNNAFLRVTSLLDGAQQTLDAAALRQWSNTSAYFNGRFVQVELLAYPGTGTSRVEISSVHAGLPPMDSVRSICDGSDDRQLSGAPPNEPDARILAPNMEGACTAFLIGDRCFLSAGHCSGAMSVLQFNVPLSNSNGSNNHPPPEDQYAIDDDSVQLQDEGIGDDWMYFGVFDNTETGMTPYDAQGEMYTLASSVPSPSNQTLRLRGYGSTTQTEAPNEWDNVLTWNNGPFTGQPGTTIQHRADTTGGNSGSAIYMFSTETVIGIHSHAGCHSDGGANRGTAIDHPGLQAALSNPQGICAIDAACPGSGDCCEANGTVGCNDAECCELVCSDDPFCCQTEWDGLCAEIAQDECDACLECGDADAGDCCESNGTPACEDASCCNQICNDDPFCCDVSWDSVCASAAQQECVTCMECGDAATGSCCVSNDTPYCDDEACCETICDMDAFCCSSSWDSICASAAVEHCDSCSVEQGLVYAFDMRGENDFFTFPIDINDIDDRTFIAEDLDWRPFAMEFDLDGQTLYAIDPDPEPNVLGIVDHSTGDFHPIGEISGDAEDESTIGGIAFAPDETVYVSSSSSLYTIDLGNANTELVGDYPDEAGTVIDIAVDNFGRMFGHSITENGLIEISRSTAGTSFIGEHGMAGTNFAQGMSIDRSTNVLYATLYHGGGAGTYVEWDLETGQATELLDTTPWNAEMTMAIASPLPETNCGQSYTGDCCESNGTPYCDDQTCCETVCDMDSFCCDVTWDSVCADAAEQHCDVCGEDCPEDLTGDGSVGGADLGTLLAAWGECSDPDNCPEDLTGDGNVGGADLGTLLAAWGDCD